MKLGYCMKLCFFNLFSIISKDFMFMNLNHHSPSNAQLLKGKT